jgi:membrane protease YdiL (CAAX protease family)
MKNDERGAMWEALNLAWDLGFLIAVPAFVFGFGGAYLDKRWETTPLLTVAGLLFACIISGYCIVKRVRSILQKNV